MVNHREDIIFIWRGQASQGIEMSFKVGDLVTLGNDLSIIYKIHDMNYGQFGIVLLQRLYGSSTIQFFTLGGAYDMQLANFTKTRLWKALNEE